MTAGYVCLKFGAAPASIVGKGPTEIARFYARKTWIGKGVGARLMQAYLDEAARAGCDIVRLEVWERNLRAITFYRKWDFVEEVTGHVIAPRQRETPSTRLLLSWCSYLAPTLVVFSGYFLYSPPWGPQTCLIPLPCDFSPSQPVTFLG